ncbi:MAG: SDR family oxidoreductase [Myxococcales bacterium]|nr:SDR family oxidoreductase [Myxococcales bacterium]
MTQKILITGSSAGFGTLTTEHLLKARHRVAASMREPRGRNAGVAERLEKAGAMIATIDVTDDASVEQGVAAAIDALGGLDVVINNAGLGVTGLAESFTPEDFRRLFDINVFGVQRMIRATAPVFRAQRSGLFIHVSSLLGRMTMPFYGPYCASKWALEALAENYRTELSAFGIETAIVEPGGFATTFMDNLMRPSDRSRESEYGELAGAPEAALRGFHELLANSPAQDPQNVRAPSSTWSSGPRANDRCARSSTRSAWATRSRHTTSSFMH